MRLSGVDVSPSCTRDGHGHKTDLGLLDIVIHFDCKFMLCKIQAWMSTLLLEVLINE